MKLVFLGANNPETIREIPVHKRANPNLEVLGFLDNDRHKIGKDFYGYPVLGNLPSCRNFDLNEVRFVNLITRDCPTRLETSLQIDNAGGRFGNFIHPGLSIDMVDLGVGIYIQEQVILQANVVIGSNSAINAGCIVSHEARLGSTVFLAPGSRIAGCVTVKDGVFVGVGATIMPRLSIGEWSVIGAGSVVTRDVEPFTVVAGNPAKVLRRLDDEDDFAPDKLTAGSQLWTQT